MYRHLGKHSRSSKPTRNSLHGSARGPSAANGLDEEGEAGLRQVAGLSDDKTLGRAPGGPRHRAGSATGLPGPRRNQPPLMTHVSSTGCCQE